MNNINKKVVIIGGGTGTQTVINGLIDAPNIELTVVVSMFDSGGSTGRLRKIFNIPAMGDIRRCFPAMRTPNNKSDILTDLFNIRFDAGKLKGHNLGNLILVGLLKTSSSPKEAWEKAGKLFNIKGKVYPSSMDNSNVVAEFEDGHVTEGETYIDVAASENRDPKLRIKKLYSKPQAKGFERAIEAIKNADLVIIGPGDMYTSILANFVSVGIPEALRESKAKKVYICNVLTKPGETYKMSASEHTAEILKYTGLEKLDFIIANNKRVIDKKIKKHSKLGGGEPQTQVALDKKGLEKLADKVIYADVIDTKDPTKHDSEKLSSIILGISNKLDEN